MNSFLLIDKAVGYRSTEIVNRVRRILGRRLKVGHTGTLDSTASGLLLLLTGNLTRAASYVMALPKRYCVTLKLGEVTDTCDYSGEVLEKRSWEHLCERDLDRALPAFFGTRMQIPPKVSAIRVRGKRAHALARKGKDPKLAPRPVVMTRIERIGPINPGGYVTLSVDCHQGTYIRSLVRDLGYRLECGAHVSALRRESVGGFLVSNALSSSYLFSDTEQSVRHELEKRLLPSREILAPFLVYKLNAEDEKRVRNGQQVSGLSRRHFGLVPSVICAAEGESVLSFGRLQDEKGECCFVPKTNIFELLVGVNS